MPRLTPETLASASPSAQRYAYDRGVIAPGIVHLGIGAFHRAHQAVYVDDLLARHPEWAIVGASLRRPDTKEALEPQGNLYSVLVRDASGSACRVIGSIVSIATRPLHMLEPDLFGRHAQHLGNGSSSIEHTLTMSLNEVLAILQQTYCRRRPDRAVHLVRSAINGFEFLRRRFADDTLVEDRDFLGWLGSQPIVDCRLG